MKVIRVKTKTSAEGSLKIVDMAVLQKGENVEEDAWNTIMNVLRCVNKNGSISGDGTLILDVGCLDVNTLA